jgi:hypothetical protein
MLSSGYYRRYGFVPEGLLPSTLYHYQITVVDPVGHTTTSKDLTFATPAETPYGNGPAPIPGTIQFYEFDNGGEGVAYHDVDIQNTGPKQPRADTGVEIVNEGNGRIVVAGAYPTEWLKYTVEVASTRNYTLLFQVSNAGAPGGQFHLEQDGVNVSGTITIPTLSGFGTFSVPIVPLTAGQHVLRFVWDATSKAYARVGVFEDVQFQ